MEIDLLVTTSSWSRIRLALLLLQLYNRSTRTDGRHTYIARSAMGMMVGDTFMLYNRSTRTDGRYTHTAGGAMGMMVGDVWSLRGI